MTGYDDEIKIDDQIYKTFEDAINAVQSKGASRNEVSQEEYPEINKEKTNDPDGVYAGEIGEFYFFVKRVTFN